MPHAYRLLSVIGGRWWGRHLTPLPFFLVLAANDYFRFFVFFLVFVLELTSTLGSLNNFKSSTSIFFHRLVYLPSLPSNPFYQFPPSYQPWRPKPARENPPHPPRSPTSRVPLGLRVSLVPNTSALPPVLVLQRSRMSKRAYLSPREMRKCSAVKKNAQLPMLTLVYRWKKHVRWSPIEPRGHY